MFSHEIKINKKNLYFAFFFIFILLFSGTALFHNLEGWSVVDSLYFSTATLTTVGYGDLVPTHDLSKIFTSVYTVLGVGTFLFSIGLIAEYYFYRRFSKINKELKKRKN